MRYKCRECKGRLLPELDVVLHPELDTTGAGTVLRHEVDGLALEPPVACLDTAYIGLILPGTPKVPRAPVR